jgi:hypothetical protein
LIRLLPKIGVLVAFACKDKGIYRHAHKLTDTQIKRQTENQMDRPMNGCIDTQTDR